VKPKDLVQRRFTAAAPCRLWVVDITCVRTWQGFAYVGFNVASTLKADILPLQALDTAAFSTRGDLNGLTHHSDHGSDYMALVYTDRIVELGATPSTGTVGDSYDNALAEAVNGFYKTELIRRRGHWRTVEQVELAPLKWAWWWNSQRLHSELRYRTPAEVAATYCADHDTPRRQRRPRKTLGTKPRANHLDQRPGRKGPNTN